MRSLYLLAVLTLARGDWVWAQPAPNPSTPPSGAPTGEAAPQAPQEAAPQTEPDGVSPVQIPPQQPANPEDALGFPERTEAPQFEQPAGEPDFNQQPTAEPGDMEGGLGESESIQSGDPAMIVRDKFPNLADEVQVDVSPEGVVELSGDVPRLADKLAMGEAVSEAPGSGLIVNKIDVKAPKRSDGAITREVRNKLRKDEFLQNYNINVRTREQRVYLRGEVPSYVAVEEALRQAAEVEGVRDVIVSDLRMPLPP